MIKDAIAVRICNGYWNIHVLTRPCSPTVEAGQPYHIGTRSRDAQPIFPVPAVVFRGDLVRLGRSTDWGEDLRGSPSLPTNQWRRHSWKERY